MTTQPRPAFVIPASKACWDPRRTASLDKAVCPSSSTGLNRTVNAFHKSSNSGFATGEAATTLKTQNLSNGRWRPRWADVT